MKQKRLSKKFTNASNTGFKNIKEYKQKIVDLVNKEGIKNMKKFEKAGLLPTAVNNLRRESLNEVIMNNK